MRPITVFRPYQEDIKLILPFDSSGCDSFDTLDDLQQQHSSKYFLTIGQGFRSLIARYVNIPDNGLTLTIQKGLFTLLWTSGHWLV